LNDVAKVLWRRKWLILGVTASALALSYGVTRRSHKVYRATAQLIVMPRPITPMTMADPNGSANQQSAESPETQVLMLNSPGMAYRTLVWLKNREIATGHSDSLSHLNPEAITEAVTVVAPKDTTILNVSAEAEQPEKAERLANAICQAFVD